MDRIARRSWLFSTVAHAALVLGALAWNALVPPAPPDPTAPEAASATPPASAPPARIVYQPEPAAAPAPTSAALPALDRRRSDGMPPVAAIGASDGRPRAERDARGDDGRPDDLAANAPAARISDRQVQSRPSAEAAASADARIRRWQDAAQTIEAVWLANLWRDHLAPRFAGRVSNRRLYAEITVDDDDRIIDLRLLQGTGDPECDACIELAFRHRGFTLPPLPGGSRTQILKLRL